MTMDGQRGRAVSAITLVPVSGLRARLKKLARGGLRAARGVARGRPRGQRLGARLSRHGGWDRELGGLRSRCSMRGLDIGLRGRKPSHRSHRTDVRNCP